MSHFTALVIGADPEQQLSKYAERERGPRDRSIEKWDWYVMGGRWSGWLPLKPGCAGVLGEPGVMDNAPVAGGADQASKRDIDFDARPLIPFAIVKDGVWHESGSMGWFAMVDGADPDEWAAIVARLYAESDDDALFTLFDCHI